MIKRSSSIKDDNNMKKNPRNKNKTQGIMYIVNKQEIHSKGRQPPFPIRASRVGHVQAGLVLQTLLHSHLRTLVSYLIEGRPGGTRLGEENKEREKR